MPKQAKSQAQSKKQLVDSRVKRAEQGKLVYRIDCSIPFNDDVVTSETMTKFATYLTEHLKVGGKTGQLGGKCEIAAEEKQIVVTKFKVCEAGVSVSVLRCCQSVLCLFVASSSRVARQNASKGCCVLSHPVIRVLPYHPPFLCQSKPAMCKEVWMDFVATPPQPNPTRQVLFAKRYLKFLTRKFLKKEKLRDYLRPVSTKKHDYQLRYYNIHLDDEAEE